MFQKRNEFFIQGTEEIDLTEGILYYKIQEFDFNGNEIIQMHLQSYNNDDNKKCKIGLGLALKSMKLKEQAFFQVEGAYLLSQEELLESEAINLLLNKRYWLIIAECYINQRKQDTNSIMNNILQLKEFANSLFQEYSYNQAIEAYLIITSILVDGLNQDIQRQITIEQSKCLSNIAICYVKLKEWILVITYCEQAIDLNKSNSKAYLLKARAKFEQGLKQEAKEDFIEYKNMFQDYDEKEISKYLKLESIKYFDESLISYQYMTLVSP